MNIPTNERSVKQMTRWITKLGKSLLLTAGLMAFTLISITQSALAIAVGDNVVTTSAVNVRQTPAGTPYPTGQSSGASGIVIGGPTTASLSGTSYVWWNVNFSSGQDGWVAGVYLQTVSLTPSSPTNLVASGGNNSVELTWVDNSSNETGFKIERKADVDGIWSLYATVGANSSSATDVSVVPGRVYYYRILAYNGNGNSTHTNEAHATPIGGVAPLATTRAASSVTAAAARMNASINPNGYSTTAYFQYGTTTSYGNITPSGNFGSGTSSINIYSDFSSLNSNTAFHYRVVATNSGGTTYGADVSFTTLPLPTAPTITAPGLTSSPGPILGTLTPVFEWNLVNGATGYGLYVRDLTTNTLIYDNVGGAKSGTSFTLPEGYLSNNGHEYRWATTSFSGAYESAQSSYRFFTAPAPATPILNSIAPNSVVGFNGARTFTLAGSNFLTGTKVQVAYTSNGYTYVDTADTPSSVTAGQIVVSFNTSTTVDTWRVRVKNPDGQTSGFVNLAVTNPPVSIPVSPSGLVGLLTSSGFASLAWNDNSSNETGFKVERKTGTGNWLQVATTGTNVAAYQDYGISAGYVYTYRVIAYNSSGSSSAAGEFVVTYPFSGPLSVLITSPTASSSWYAGETRSITWLTTGNVQQIGFFGVYYSLNGGATFTQLMPTRSAASVSLDWQIPSNISSSAARIKVVAFSPTGTELTNNTTSNFTIQTLGLKPVARPDVNNAGPAPGASIIFTGAASSAPAGRTIASYQWDFGDGIVGAGGTVNHSYSKVGTYSARLTVTDSSGQNDSRTLSIHVSGKSLGPDTQSSFHADPVNLATGNFILSVDDLTIPGLGFPLKFSRFYNSKDSSTSGLPIGHHWTHSYNLSLSEDLGGIVTIRFGDGRQETHTPKLSGGYTTESGVHDVLEKSSTDHFILRTKEQIACIFVAGRIESISDRNNNSQVLAYDAQGRLQSVTDSSGRAFQLTYDAQSRISVLTDPLGRTVQYAYGPAGDLTTVTNPRSGTIHYAYDELHQILTATDPNGHVFVTNEYDSQQRVVSVQRDALGNRSDFHYDFVSGLTTVTDPFGNVTRHLHDEKLRLIAKTNELGATESYEYDGENNRTAVISRNGHTTRYAYDASGNVTSKIDPLGHRTIINYNFRNDPVFRMDAISDAAVLAGSATGGYGTTFEYDENGNLSRSIDAKGNATVMTYNSAGKVLSVVDRKGNTNTQEYDPAGNRIRSVDAMAGVVTATFDAAGRILSTTDQNSHTTVLTYDLSDHLLTLRNPLNQTITHTYDPNGNRISTQDPRGGTTTCEYDLKDRLVKVTDAMGGIVCYEYDAYDRKKKTIDAKGNVSLFEYDAAGRPSAIVDPLGNRTIFSHDANGNQTAVTDPLGKITHFTYDPLDQLVATADALGNVTTCGYDALGRKILLTDALGRDTTSEYDVLGKLVKVTDAAGGTVLYAYDAEGNRTGMTNPLGKITLSFYDALNRLIRREEPAGSVESYEYDGVGNRTKRIDPKNQSVSYEYDSANRLTRIVYPAGLPVIFTYDENGNRLSMQDTVGTSAYAYDLLNRMTSCTNPFGQVVGYEYDLNSNRKAMIYPGSKRVDYTHDAANRMLSVTDWANHTTTYQYDTVGRLTSTQNPNGTSAMQTYDDAGRLATLSNRGPGNTVISEYTYTLDPVGNHLQVQQQEPIDPTPNLGDFSYSYDDEDRIQQMEGNTQINDANGNLISNGNGVQLNYDYENRLIHYESGADYSNWKYDGTGKRLQLNTGASENRFVLDVNSPLTQVIATSSSGNIFEYYIYGLGLVSKLDTSGTATYYHYDSRGSTISMTGDTGTPSASFAYDPFGRIIGKLPANTTERFTFMGRHGVMDDNNGFHFVRARHYSTRNGRFLSRDLFLGLVDQSQTLNRYVYGLNSPLNKIDVTGFFSADTFYTGIGQTSYSYLMLGASLGALAVDGMSGNGVSIASGFIDAADKINESTRYMSVGPLNVKRSFSDQNAIPSSNGIGIFDEYLENNYVAGIRDANKLFSTVSILRNPTGAVDDITDSIGLLRNTVGFSDLTQLLSIYQLTKKLDDVTGIWSRVNESSEITASMLKKIIGFANDVKNHAPPLSNKK